MQRESYTEINTEMKKVHLKINQWKDKMENLMGK